QLHVAVNDRDALEPDLGAADRERERQHVVDVRARDAGARVGIEDQAERGGGHGVRGRASSTTAAGEGQTAARGPGRSTVALVELDTATEFGARVARRLREELIAWLVTVHPDGTPQPVPVWFLWDGRTVLLYSQPDTGKLRNLAANPRVALHLDGDGRGGDIVVLTGEARVVTDVPPADRVPAYLE